MADDVALLDAPAATETTTPAAETLVSSVETPVAPTEAPATETAAPEAQAAPEPVEIEYPEEGDTAEADAPAATPEPQPGQTPGPEPDRVSARFGTAALTRMLKDQPELAKAAEQNPAVRAQLYQMARRSQDLAKYQDLLPSVVRAQEAVTAQQTLQNIERVYATGDPAEFWRGLYDAGSASGAYQRNVQFLHQTFLDRLGSQAVQSGDTNLGSAVQAIRDFLGWGNSRTPSSQAADGRQSASEQNTNLPAHIRQRLEQADLDARELQNLRSRRSQEEQQAQEHFLDETANEAGRELRSFVEGILAQAKLSDYDKQNIARDFIEEVVKLADQDKVHNAALDELLRGGGASPRTRTQMVARVKAWARQNGREILEPILQRAGAGLKQRQAQRETVASRQRSEPATTGAPAQPRQLSARDMVKQAQTKLGRRLTDREILDLA